MTVTALTGDALAVLRGLPSNSVQCCVTSPPYYGLRSYLPPDHPDKALEIGLEDTPDAYVARMVKVFREVRRVLRPDGVCWLNLGDSYASRPNGPQLGASTLQGSQAPSVEYRAAHALRATKLRVGIKHKDLLMIPAQVAIALRADGWWLRSDVIWHKPNPMPESCTDRPTSSHEHVFQLSKSGDYLYDDEAIREGATGKNAHDVTGGRYSPPGQLAHTGSRRKPRGVPPYHAQYESSDQRGLDAVPRGFGRNARNVWTIATRPFPGAHFATMPPELAERCILAGTSEVGACPHCGAPYYRITEKGDPDIDAQRACGGGALGGYFGAATKDYAAAGVQDPSAVKARILEGMRPRLTIGWEKDCDCLFARPVPCTVIDPFGGAGTTGLVADRLGRDAVLIDLNAEFVALTHRRITGDAPLFSDVVSMGPTPMLKTGSD